MEERMDVGILGFGQAGRNMHWKTLAQLDDIVNVVAVFDVRPVTREGNPEKDFPLPEDVTIYDDLDAFLEHPGLQTVHVTTPSGYHSDGVIAAANAGKNVLCDKPLDITMKRINAAITAADDNDVQLAVNYQHRLNPVVQYIKRAIGEGYFGELVSAGVKCKLFRDAAYYDYPWHGVRDIDGGGALMNQSVHYIDLLQWLIGSPDISRAVSGIRERRYHKDIDAEDYGYGVIEFKNGFQVSILGGTCYEDETINCESLNIHGTNGFLVLNEGKVVEAEWDGKDQLAEGGYFASDTSKPTAAAQTRSPIIGLENHERLFRATYDALMKGEQVPIPGTEGRAAVEMILRIYHASEALRTGKPFSADYAPGNF